MPEDNSKKRQPGMPRSPERVIVVVSGRLGFPSLPEQLPALVMTSMTRFCGVGGRENGPARRRANADQAGHDGTLTRSCTHRREARRAQEKRKAPAKGGQLTTTAYASVQDLRRIGVAAGKAKTWTRVPLRTTPWA